MRKFLKILTIVLAVLLLAAGLSAVTFTPPILTRGGIAVRKTWEINGVKQWVLIRGADRTNNPLLVVVHGGPGMPSNGTMRLQNRELEKHFTVAYWEQRGAGYSYRKDIPDETMTIDYFVEDLRVRFSGSQADRAAAEAVIRTAQNAHTRHP